MIQKYSVTKIQCYRYTVLLIYSVIQLCYAEIYGIPALPMRIFFQGKKSEQKYIFCVLQKYSVTDIQCYRYTVLLIYSVIQLCCAEIYSIPALPMRNFFPRKKSEQTENFFFKKKIRAKIYFFCVLNPIPHMRGGRGEAERKPLEYIERTLYLT